MADHQSSATLFYFKTYLIRANLHLFKKIENSFKHISQNLCTY